jgi:hypothetical protein
MIAAFCRNWERFFHRQVPPHLFALVRIVFGMFLLLYWFTLWSSAQLHSTDGVLLPRFGITSPSLHFLFHPDAFCMRIFFACMFALLLSFTMGFAVQLSSALLLLSFIYFNLVSQRWFAASFYRLFEFTCVVFLLPGADKTFSVRMIREAGSFFAWEPISILPQRLLALQVSFTYFGVGWQKLILPQWNSGRILWQGFTGRWGTAFAFWLARILPAWMFDWMIHGTKLLELLIPFGLWSKRFRGWFFVGGFLFHTLITFTLGIWWFQFLIPLYIVFFTPEEVYEFLQKHSRGRIR